MRKYSIHGKELDTSNNLWWYDYGARQYDPTAPRFTTPDPLAEKYYGWNMYGYCMNNPMSRIDPDGKDGVRIIDNENKTITIQATYYVVTKGGNCPYNEKDIEKMNNIYNKRFNDQVKNKTITQGEFQGYSLVFDFTFVDGGSYKEARHLASIDVIAQQNNEGETEYLHKGNVLSRNDSKEHPSFDISEDGHMVGGETFAKREITMNRRTDSKQNKAHEIGHTLGLTHPVGGGVGLMAYPTGRINKQQVNELGNMDF